MVTLELEQILFEELGYNGGQGLKTDSDLQWPNGRAIPDINAALFLKDNPIAYFSRLSELDPDRVLHLHKNVWSQSKAPLLFVILPHEIRIYNSYEPTPKPDEDLDTSPRLLQCLSELTDYLTAQRKIREQLVEENHYERIYLETGAFWDSNDGQRINYRNRADQQLIESMSEMRKLLTDAGISNHIAYTLLGRSIFIRYLEDRGVLTSDLIESMTDGQAHSYRDTLTNRKIAYLLYHRLSQRFNGDLFPVEQAEKDVAESHLQLLLSFLNRTNLKTGQLSLWPYNFEYIPIELISNIYDIFLDDQRASGAYYTPLPLADFILEETIGDDVIQPDMSILDPACGSGVFLVGAYRRFIQAWRQIKREPTAQDLSQILQNNIFGIDKNPEAVRIAAFSLYLEILNHLSNEQILDASFQFSPILGKNLLNCDFFLETVNEQLGNRKFDRVVGNMPWGRATLTKNAIKWLAKRNYIVGSKQAAPAFMLRAPEFCKENGEIALLAPTKSTIMVTSRTHQKFRDKFFADFHVRAVVNFSALVYELFPNAISPAAAIFYTLNPPASKSKLIYGVPKPSALSQHLKAIVLDTTEIKFLNKDELLSFPQLWKIASWGTPRDAVLIDRLKSIPTMIEQSKRLGWQDPREGFQVGESKDKEKNEKRKRTPKFLKKLPFLPTERFQSFSINTTYLVPTSEKRVHRPREEEIYKSPLVLIHQTKCQAAFVNKDISFLASISVVNGKRGQEELLKWLACVINSRLTRYYQFLTSTRWAVERANPLHKEYKDMPLLIPDDENPKFKRTLYHFDKIVEFLNQGEVLFDSRYESELKKHEKAINRLVFEIYGLHPIEQQLVEDMLEYGIEFFNWVKRKNRRPQETKPVQKPDVAMLKSYVEIFAGTAGSVLKVKNRVLNATVYKNGAPLTVVSFELVDLDKKRPVKIISKFDVMRSKLRELDKLLLEKKTPSMFMRRHVRVYDGKQISLVRPSERRYWTKSQARTDADAFLAELSS